MNGKLAVARTRKLFDASEVNNKLQKLKGTENGSLRETYERMLSHGEDRFQVKPGCIHQLQALKEELPNFAAVIDDMHRQLALCLDSDDAMEIAPLLLLGPPGIGKTHFARCIAKLLGTGFGMAPMSSMTAGWILSGTSSQWKGARAGKVFETLVDGEFANPVMLIDEIDKCRAEQAYDPLGALYTLLEHETACSFVDEFAEIGVDASQVVWIATANDEARIPEPILNRMHVYAVPEPTHDEALGIARRIHDQIRREHHWGQRFAQEPHNDCLDKVAGMGPRQMRKTWMTAFANAKLASRSEVLADDVPATVTARKGQMGFIN